MHTRTLFSVTLLAAASTSVNAADLALKKGADPITQAECESQSWMTGLKWIDGECRQPGTAQWQMCQK